MSNLGALAPSWGMHHLGQLLISLFINGLMNLVATTEHVSHHFGVNREAKTQNSAKTSCFERLSLHQGCLSMINIKNGNFFWTILRLARYLHKTECIRELTTGVIIENYRNITS